MRLAPESLGGVPALLTGRLVLVLLPAEPLNESDRCDIWVLLLVREKKEKCSSRGGDARVGEAGPLLPCPDDTDNDVAMPTRFLILLLFRLLCF